MAVQGHSELITLPFSAGSTGTTATTQLVSPTRVASTLTGATFVDDHLQVQGPAWTAPGLWFVVWTVSGPGAGVYVTTVDVMPTGYLTTRPRAYATTTDLATYLYGTSSAPQPLPDDAEGRLARATVRVDRILKAAVYPVDDDGEPTTDDVKAALRDMVCELVAWWIDTGDESGAMLASGGGSVTAGQISLSRSGGKAVLLGGYWVSAQMLAIADNAGLLNQRPWTR